MGGYDDPGSLAAHTQALSVLSTLQASGQDSALGGVAGRSIKTKIIIPHPHLLMMPSIMILFLYTMFRFHKAHFTFRVRPPCVGDGLCPPLLRAAVLVHLGTFAWGVGLVDWGPDPPSPPPRGLLALTSPRPGTPPGQPGTCAIDNPRLGSDDDATGDWTQSDDDDNRQARA